MRDVAFGSGESRLRRDERGARGVESGQVGGGVAAGPPDRIAG